MKHSYAENPSVLPFLTKRHIIEAISFLVISSYAVWFFSTAVLAHPTHFRYPNMYYYFIVSTVLLAVLIATVCTFSNSISYKKTAKPFSMMENFILIFLHVTCLLCMLTILIFHNQQIHMRLFQALGSNYIKLQIIVTTLLCLVPLAVLILSTAFTVLSSKAYLTASIHSLLCMFFMSNMMQYKQYALTLTEYYAFEHLNWCLYAVALISSVFLMGRHYKNSRNALDEVPQN